MNRKLFSALSTVAILALTICGAFADDTSGALTIDASSLTDEPAFIDWIQGDTPMQLIVLKGADSGVRLAFNTPLGTPLGLVHWKRASSPAEAGTAGHL